MAALIPQLVAPRTDSGAFNGTNYQIDNTVFRTMSPDWTISIDIDSMLATYARFSVQDSIDGTTWISGPTFEASGAWTKVFPYVVSWKKKDFPGLRLGVANAVLRVALTLLRGTAPSITWQAYYQGVLSN